MSQTVIIKNSKALTALVVGAATAPLLFTAPAAADHRGGATTGVLNTVNWRVCSGDLMTPAVKDSMDRAISILNSRTARLNVRRVGACGDANVINSASTSPETYYGVTRCLDWGSGTNCQQKFVFINTRTCSTARQKDKSTLHEMGHVGGLGHRFTNASVMTSGESPPIATTFDDHDVVALNNEY